MFKVNDVIVYGTQGVCKIVGIEKKAVNGVKKDYFVLKPVEDCGSTLFVPTDNEHVRKKMRRLLSREEINDLVGSMAAEDAPWIINDNERKESYRKILANGDYVELIKNIKAIYTRKMIREAEGKRLHMMDEQFLRNAEQILYNEFRYVLALKNKDELLQYIFLGAKK